MVMVGVALVSVVLVSVVLVSAAPVKCISSMRWRVLSLSTFASNTSVLTRNSVMAGRRGRMSAETSNVPSWR